MKLFWSVSIGAALGGASRFYLGSFIQQRAGMGFPAGTFVINVTGSLILGFIMRYSLQSGVVSPEVRALLTTGFCGGFTTFSTFSYETALLLDDGEYGRAALYMGASVAIALVGVFLGFALANGFLALRRST